MKNILFDIAGLLKYKKRVTGISIFALFFVLTACKQNEQTSVLSATTKLSGYALGTTYLITYENTSTSDSLKIRKAIEGVFTTVNQSMSTYLPTSAISKINKGDTTVIVDQHFKKVFLKSAEVWELTEGYFDPTVGSLVNAWGFGPGKQLNDISAKQIDSLLNYVGFDKLRLTNDLKIQKASPEIFLDFNALAKGYTIDLLGEIFNDLQIDNYLIELGGEILTKGKNPKTQREWVLAIDDPTQEDIENRRFTATLNLSNKAMATSGNYRKFRVDTKTGERFVHTIDPKTGYTKKSNVLSVSVIASNCMEADAYATAFMAMDLDNTKKLLDTLKHIDAYIIIATSLDKTEVFKTSGFETLLRK